MLNFKSVLRLHPSKGVPKISLFLLSSHIIFWAEENRWRKTFGFHGLIEKVFAYHLCRLAGKIIGTRYTADSLINLDTPVEFQAFVLTGYLISYQYCIQFVWSIERQNIMKGYSHTETLLLTISTWKSCSFKVQLIC